MKGKNNSASRVLKVFQEAKNRNSNHPHKKVWASVFGTDETNHAKTYSYLGLLGHEIDEIEKSAKAIEIPSSLYKSTFDVARRLINPANLSEAWSNLGNGFDQKCLHTFEWISYVLPSDSVISEEYLQELYQDLENLEKQLESGSLNAAQEAFIKDQISILKTGLADAHIRGDKAFEKAISEVMFEVVASSEKQEVLDSLDKGKPEVQSYVKVFSKCRPTYEKICAEANKAKPVFDIALAGYKLITST